MVLKAMIRVIIWEKGDYRSSPWIVSMGPVSVISMAFACTSLKEGPATIEDFCNHIRSYGIELDIEEVGRCYR